VTEEDLNPVEVALPTSHVLSYLTTTGSPTRVRRVASVGMWVVGALNVGITLPFWWAAFVVLYFNIRWRGIARWDWTEIISGYQNYAYEMFQNLFGWHLSYVLNFEREVMTGAISLVFIPALAICGIGMLIGARGVKRGRRPQSLFGLCAMVVPTISLLGLAVVLGCTGIAWGTGVGGPADSAGFIWLAISIVLIPIILIFIDLIRFLKWIAQNPMEEKPRVGFLPGNAS
jgi:hypothetical protein